MIMGQPIITVSGFIWNRISRPRLVIISFQIKVKIIAPKHATAVNFSVITSNISFATFSHFSRNTKNGTLYFPVNLKLSANRKVSGETELMVISILFSCAG